MRAAAPALVLALLAAGAMAAPFELPVSARLLSERNSAFDSYILPTGAFAAGQVPGQGVEGAVERLTWRLTGSAVTTLQILSPLVGQLEAKGFSVVFECKDTECGGFDFRFGTEVVPAPDMHVDIRDFRFLSATRPDGAALSLLVSRSRDAAYVQMIHVTPGDAASRPSEPVDAPAGTTPPLAAAGTDLVAVLLDKGHVVLPDLDFATGAGELADGAYAALGALATFLSARPDLMIAIVGHTDSTGALESNIALSRQRAGAVRARLIERHGVAPAQLRAEGMGYLAPIASNLTPEGREANRRVEAILLPMP
jgi:OOP family OmpA-OmpF porin